MTSINLDGLSSLALVKAETKVNLDGVSALALIYTPPNNSITTKLRFLNYLNVLYNLDYVFTEENHIYWNISPVYLEDPSNKKRSVVRLTALNGNGKYTGYRDFIYSRIDLADYLATLGPVTHMTERYRGQSPIEAVKNLIAQEFSEGEVDIQESTVDEVTTFTITVVDDNSPLWYGSGSVSITDIPEISKVVPVHSIVLMD